MSNFNFTSQICTTKEQSERLLALGLKKETADMKYPCITEYYGGILTEGMSSLPMIINTEDDEVTEYDLPAWSLHKLIEIMPKIIIKDLIRWYLCLTPYYNNQVAYENYNYEVAYLYKSRFDSLYDNIIDCIEWLINVEQFNKEYLEE